MSEPRTEHFHRAPIAPGLSTAEYDSPCYRDHEREAATPPLDVDPSTALAHWLCHGPEDKHTGDSMPCLPHYRMAHDFAARLAQQDGTGE